MKRLLAIIAIAEAVTGLALVVAPAFAGSLLVGWEISGSTAQIGRVAGIALIALGIACWPRFTPLCGMWTYGVLVTSYLGWLGIRGEWAGPLLWPAVALHGVLTILLARLWFVTRAAKSQPKPD